MAGLSERAAFLRFGWLAGLGTGIIGAWKPLLLWLVANVVGLALSGFLNNMLDAVSGRPQTEVTLFGQGQLLNPAAALATGAVGVMLWQGGVAPPPLKLIVGVAAILMAAGAVGLSVDQHVAGSIAAQLKDSGVAVPAGGGSDWLTWITNNDLLPTAQRTATFSEWLFGATFITGGLCVVLSEAK